MNEYTVDFSFTCRVTVKAKDVNDAVNIALIEMDPKKVTMDSEAVVFENGKQPVIVELKKG